MKCKNRGNVFKRRTGISEAEMSLLRASTVPEGWCGSWFREVLEERRFLPSCHVSYRRLAREGEVSGMPVRATLDRDLRCATAIGLCPGQPHGPQLLIPITLLELKYQGGLPGLFEELIHTFGLSPAVTSKYRHAAKACMLSRIE
jgi:hypothetical protein